MATILAVYNSNGCAGRCDARCHEAVNDECRCICGGAFHGVGSKIAWEDRHTLTDDEIKETCRQLKVGGTLRVRRTPEQIPLFAGLSD